MSLCNILFLTSLKPKHGFASNFLWMFLGWTRAKFVKILCNFWSILKKYFSIIPLTRNHSYIWFGRSQEGIISSLFCGLYLFTHLMNNLCSTHF